MDMHTHSYTSQKHIYPYSAHARAHTHIHTEKQTYIHTLTHYTLTHKYTQTLMHINTKT